MARQRRSITDIICETANTFQRNAPEINASQSQKNLT
nr:NinE family protein [Bacillus paranthracis]